MRKTLAFVLLVFITVFIFQCKKQGKAPLLTTVNVRTSSDLSITAEGIVYSEGDAPITEKGLVWSKTTGTPYLSDSQVLAGNGPSSFSASLTDLEPFTYYYLRTFATNKYGTGYGDVKTIQTGKGPEIPLTFTKLSYDASENSMNVLGGISNIKTTGSVIQSGFCWSSTGLPVLNKDHQDVKLDAQGNMSVTITGLQSNTTYSIRAYAAAKNGTVYGAIITSKTAFGTMTDYDNNVYKTVQIGDQVWMAENLRATHYSDGTPLTQVSSSTDWSNAINGGAWCYVSNNTPTEPLREYGLIYNYATIKSSKQIAPPGWHVPSTEEYNTLLQVLGNNYYQAPLQLKSARPNLWTNSFNQTNCSGFAAVPAGNRNKNGNFYEKGTGSFFWTSSSINYQDDSYLFYITDSYVQSSYYSLAPGCSIRLVQD